MRVDFSFSKFIFNHLKGGCYDTGKKKWKHIQSITNAF